MTNTSAYKGFLRQLSLENSVEQRYLLSTTKEIILGREPQCQIAVDPFLYGSVSRRHAKIEPVSSSPSGLIWQVCDLSSANGTYLNGQRLQGSQALRTGDRLALGENGPEFIFECQFVNKTAPPLVQSDNPPVVNPRTSLSNTIRSTSPNQKNDITSTELFPIFSAGKDLTQKTYLMPVSITVGFVFLMFAAQGSTASFNLLLTAYIAGAAYYFIYKRMALRRPEALTK